MEETSAPPTPPHINAKDIAEAITQALSHVFSWKNAFSAALLAAAEYAMLSLIEEAPRSIKLATLIIPVLAFLTIQFEKQIRKLHNDIYPIILVLLFIGYVGFGVYVYSSPFNPHSMASNKGYLWAPLTDEEESSLETELKKLPKPTAFQIICLRSDCRELSGNLISAFRGSNWPVSINLSGAYTQPIGLVLYQVDKKNRALADAIERATKGRLKIESIEESSFPNTDSLFVGVKP